MGSAGSRGLTCSAIPAQLLSGERRKHLPGGGEDREVPVAGVEVKLRARYRLGVEPGMPGRDRRVRVPVRALRNIRALRDMGVVFSLLGPGAGASAVADWVCPGRAPYLTPQASRSTHASRAGPAAAAAATAAGPPDADPGRADRLPAPPAGAAALRRAAVTGDTHPPPGHTAWMSQPCRSHGVDVASTP